MISSTLSPAPVLLLYSTSYTALWQYHPVMPLLPAQSLHMPLIPDLLLPLVHLLHALLFPLVRILLSQSLYPVSVYVLLLTRLSCLPCCCLRYNSCVGGQKGVGNTQN